MKYLIAGLGNIGIEYAGTRHNIGYDVLDFLAARHHAIFESRRLAYVTNFRTRGRTFWLIKPTTYMNLSGRAVRYWLDATKISLENQLVVTDDLNLPFGKLRMRSKGSSGGHNGIEHIISSLSTSQFSRLRLGIGSEFSKGKQTGYVLGKWNEEEQSQLAEFIKKAADAIVAFGTIGAVRAMNQFNSK